MAYGALKLKDGTNNEAEFQATMLALKCIKKCEGRKIILEGDSMVVIQAVSKNLIQAWHLKKIGINHRGVKDFQGVQNLSYV